MDKETLKQIEYFTKKGCTLEMIAKHLKISPRTLSRKLKSHKKDLKIWRAYYQSYLEGWFK